MFRHFDCDENTSEENKKARSKFVYRVATTTSSSDTMDPVALAMLSKLKEQMKPDPVYNDDPFTCYVIEIVAITIYGNDLPQDPPDKALDSPALYQDKLFYHHAAQQARIFRDESLGPHLNALVHLLESNGMSLPELEQKDYDFTGDETEMFKALHNMFHLSSYINSAVRESISSTQADDMTFLRVWEHLTTEQFKDKPVREWAELTTIDFVEYVYQLYRVWEFTHTLYSQ